MKLGIVVVYMAKAENRALLQLHLEQIKSNTTGSYKIYACINRLQDDFIPLLESCPEVNIVPCEDTPMRGGQEHAFYLEQLIRVAIADGADMVATLHPDSFPVRKNWNGVIANSLSMNCPLATVSRNGYLIQYTSCLFFLADFYKRYNPSLRLKSEVKSTDVYRDFSENCPHHPDDSGVGFVFKAYLNGLKWITLDDTAYRNGLTGKKAWRMMYASVFGNTIFHLEGAFRYDSSFGKPKLYLMMGLPWVFHSCYLIITGRKDHGIIAGGGKSFLSKLYETLVSGPLYADTRQRLLASPVDFFNRIGITENGSRS